MPTAGAPAVSAAAPFHQTDFEGESIGDDPADWLDTGAFNSMAADDALFAVADAGGTQAFSTASTASNIHSHFTGAGSDALERYSYEGRMQASAADAGYGVTFLSDYPQSDSYYRLRRYGSGSFRLSPHGTSVTGGTVDTGVVPTAGTWYRFHIEVEVDHVNARTDIRARVWPDGSAEPSTWQIDAYDDSASRRTAGTFGVWSHGNGQKYWDDLTVTEIPLPGPHTLTATATGNGSVAADPTPGPYVHGSTVDLTAVPDPGWAFAGWSGDAGGLDNPLTMTMLADASVDATFVEVVPATLTVDTAGAGTVTVDPQQAQYSVGDVVTLTALPDPGQVFVGWSGAVTGQANPLVLQLDGDTSLTATFDVAPPSLLDADFEADAVGDDPAGWVDTGPQNGLGVDDSLFAVDDVGGTRAFGTTSTASNIHSHYVDAVLPSAANYVAGGRMLMTDQSGGIGVTVLSDYPQSDSYYRLRRYGAGSFRLSPHGTTITGGVTDTGVVPAAGTWYRFLIEVADLGTETTIKAKVWEDGTAEPTGWQIDAVDSSFTRHTAGTFGLWSHGAGGKYWDDVYVAPIATDPFTVTTSATGQGTVTRSPDLPEYDPFSSVTVTATPDPGWEFTGWSGGLTGTTNPATVVVTDDLDITATFAETIVTYTLTTDVVGLGSVVRNPNAATYEDGTTVDLTAVADPGWAFTGWSGDLSGTTNPASIVLDADRTVTATFTPTSPLTVTVATSGNGSASIDPDLPSYGLGQTVTLTAAPDPGSILDHWTIDPPATPAWWDQAWGYRVPVTVDADGTTRVDTAVEADVDFSAAWASLGVSGDFDPASVRVVEVSTGGAVIDPAVPFQFDAGPGFDAQTNAVGTVTILLAGQTDAAAQRHYDVYFDDVAAGHAAASVAALVSVTDGVPDAGEDTFEIVTPDTTYYFDKEGGGFTSIVDADGLDWLGYGPAAGSQGQYRGIPNMVYPEGVMHPGATGVTSTLVEQGPLKASIHSETAGGVWETVWDIFPDRARMTVLNTGHSYWFLYEGTPGGELDLGTDVVVRSDGTQTTVSDSWTGDLAGEEWVYFGDPADGRSLYVANHEQDGAVDSYFQLDGNMTVFGFGRSGTGTYLTAEPAEFTIGLVDSVDLAPVSAEIQAAMRPMTVTVGAAASGQGTSTLTGDVVSFDVSASHTVTAVFVAAPTPTVTLGTTGSGTASANPDLPQYLYGQTVEITATADPGWEFTGWTGDLSGTTNPLSFSITADMTVSATFELEAADAPDIDIWYGTQQTYGSVGVPQPYYNVLGNVSDPDGVASLSYTLNGGSPVSLSIGSDDRRLANSGDFNADVREADLVPGANQVAITAIDTLGNSRTRTVTVDYTDNVWPSTYSIDWSSAATIGEVAQVTDGEWAIEGGGLRTQDPDYDRLVAIGDTGWTDYEIEVPITVHAIDPEGFQNWTSGSAAAIGLLMRWNGHTDNPVAGMQPKTGWLPYGAIGWYWWTSPTSGSLRLEGNNGSLIGYDGGFPLSVGGTYVYKMRVESISGVGGRYSLKVWPQGSPEPSGWSLVGQQGASDPQNGSLLLLAHHIDATFGDVTITPLGGSDVTLDVTTSGSGSVTVDPDQPTYTYGDVVSLTAVPDAGFVFAGWSGDATGSANPLSLTLDGSKSVTATFVPENQPPTISALSVTPFVNAATVTWTTDVPASSEVAYGETTGYELGTETDPVLKTQHSITLTGLTSETLHHFQVTSVGAGGGSSSSSDQTFTTLAQNPSGFVSEDFNECALDTGLWTFVDPLGDGGVVVNGTQLELSVPGGVNHDVWTGGNMAPRVMQSVGDADFEVEAGFESAVTDTNEMQGILVEQAPGEFLRFDVYGSGGQTYVFAARFVAGQPTVIANVALGAPSTTNPQVGLRVTRAGDTWTLTSSLDGGAWTPVATFVHALTVSEIGVFAGNAGAAPAHTAVVDYVFETSEPIVPEDPNSSTLTVGTVGSGSVTVDPDQPVYACDEQVTLTAVPDAGFVFDGWSGDASGSANPLLLTMDGSKSVTATFVVDSGQQPPVISALSVTPFVDSATVSWTTDVPASSEVAYGETAGYELGTETDPTLRTSHSITLTGLAAETLHHFQVTSVGAGGSSSSPDQTFTTLAQNPSGFVSEDFNECALDTGLWSFVDPLGDGGVVVNGTQLELSVPGGVNHDVWTGGNMAPRVMQSVGDADFEVEAGFESAVTDTYEMQGLIIEQAPGEFLRFDVYGNAGQTYVFAARFVGGSPTALANVALGVPSTTAPQVGLRVTRVGDTWTLAASLDGGGWSTVTSFVHALTVSELGVFAGNAGAAPAHTAVVDYVFETSAPIVPEDPNAVTCP
ncbi:MAG: InlB B-repeat-containing protein [Ilumatobacter sp.]|uniref:InlB B-repeat-containing protein n=1 Tax=Ilumatobacter sp. TaxID=1967498 RepID=UPI002612ED86|nr:InlB B-repeat-containing protein [Ilumatobacter sp.]MDJ0768692.1 InlB B-repeat-containing protein [Ilumatobacter sp.]